MSRQRRWQLRKEREGRCSICGAPSDFNSRCLKCAVKVRESVRKKRGARKRYASATYRAANGEPAKSSHTISKPPGGVHLLAIRHGSPPGARKR